jgi:hypothetical protein
VNLIARKPAAKIHLCLAARMATLCESRTSNRPPSSNEIEDEYDDGKNQQDMNPAAQRVTTDQPYNP